MQPARSHTRKPVDPGRWASGVTASPGIIVLPPGPRPAPRAAPARAVAFLVGRTLSAGGLALLQAGVWGHLAGRFARASSSSDSEDEASPSPVRSPAGTPKPAAKARAAGGGRRRRSPPAGSAEVPAFVSEMIGASMALADALADARDAAPDPALRGMLKGAIIMADQLSNIAASASVKWRDVVARRTAVRDLRATSVSLQAAVVSLATAGGGGSAAVPRKLGRDAAALARGAAELEARAGRE